MGSLRQRLLTFSYVSLLVGFSTAKGFNREQCYSTIQSMLQSNTTLSSDATIFFNRSGTLLSDPAHPSLTNTGCEAICGAGIGLYSDFAARLLTWLIPGVLLITNMQYAPIGKRRFLMILHLFGDPIDSFWSLLVKVERWNRCSSLTRPYIGNARSRHPRIYEKRVRNMAVIFSAMDEINFDIERGPFCTCRNLDSLYEETAGDIIDCRTSGTARTWLSIFLYIVGVVAAFIPAFGGNPTPSSTKIAPALLLSWMLSIILLSNVVGQFNSPQNCIRIISGLEEALRKRQDEHREDCNRRAWPESGDWDEYLDNLAWSGGIYSCQLDKSLPGTAGYRPWVLITVSFLPLAFSFAAAFTVLYSAPTYLSCRHFMIIYDLLAWISSAVLTWLIRDSRQRRFLLVLKDALIGIPIVFLLIASSCGLFNSCRCWSGFSNNEGVQLNPEAQFNRNDNVIYPAVVATCFFLQLFIYKVVYMKWIGKVGFGIMRWTEKELRDTLPKNKLETRGPRSGMAVKVGSILLGVQGVEIEAT